MKAGSGRGPSRIFATDSDGNAISLVYFNNPGWAKRMLPKGEKRIVSGKLEQYGDEWQIVHPEVAEPGKGPPPLIREPVYPLTEGLTNRRLGELARRRLDARRSLPNGSSRACFRARRGGRGGARSLKRTGSRARAMLAGASLTTRFSPISSRCSCSVSRSGGIAPRRSPGRAS